DLGGVVPEGGGLDLAEVAHDQPLQLGQGPAVELAVGRPDGGVLADHEEAGNLAVGHVQGRLVGGVVTGDAGQVVEAEVVGGGGRRSPPRLEEADDVGVGVTPEAARRRRALDVAGQGLGPAAGVGHGEVAGQDVVEGGDVGGALDAGVAPQGQDPAAGAAHVAQQEL